MPQLALLRVLLGTPVVQRLTGTGTHWLAVDRYREPVVLSINRHAIPPLALFPSFLASPLRLKAPQLG